MSLEISIYLGFSSYVGKKRQKNTVRHRKDAEKIVLMAMDHEARDDVKNVNYYRGGRILLRVAKQRAGENLMFLR